MFQFTRFPLSCKDMTLYRLLHSEILASKFVCNFTKLIAAYHVLHRLLLPRHPLCALHFFNLWQLTLLLIEFVCFSCLFSDLLYSFQGPCAPIWQRRKNNNCDSLERRWSIRTFPYGYLVTTSPQSLTTPSEHPSLRLGLLLQVQPTLVVWRAVCTRPENVFTATLLICDY